MNTSPASPTLDPRFDAIITDMVALESIVRALMRSQAGRSRTAMTDVLDSLSTEADRLRTCPTYSGVDRSGVCAVLEAWVEDLKSEAWAAERATV